MDKAQYLLTKLAEECVEVAQRALKQIQFGKDEIQDGQPLTNTERLSREIIDLICVTRLLEETEEFPELLGVDIQEEYEKKKAKMQKYLDLSAKLGRLPEITL